MKTILCIISLVLITLISGCARVGYGSVRIGNIVKIGREGYWHKTIEVEIIKGGLNGGTGGFGAPFYFTIDNDELAQKATSLLNAGKEIKVTYHEDVFCPWSSELDSCTFADSIEAN